MIVYLANKTQFRDDILSNRIEEIVHESFQRELGKSVGASELASWKNSLRHMDTVLEDAGIPDDVGVAIEFNIPQTGKRVDFIVTGTRGDGQRTAVIVELKQWQEAKATTKDAIVSTFVGGREREVKLSGKKFEPAIEKPYRWRDWAARMTRRSGFPAAKMSVLFA